MREADDDDDDDDAKEEKIEIGIISKLNSL